MIMMPYCGRWLSLQFTGQAVFWHPAAAELQRPVDQLLVAGPVSGKRPVAQAPADRVEGDGHVDVLVGVDADDDSTAPRIRFMLVTACPSSSRPGRGTRRWPAGWTGL
jgi:hypothetical protein